MAVKVNDADGAICLGDTSQKWERDGVVTAKGNDSRQSLALQRKPLLIGVGVRLPHKQIVVSLFNLLDSISIVVSDQSIESDQPTAKKRESSGLTK